MARQILKNGGIAKWYSGETLNFNGHGSNPCTSTIKQSRKEVKRMIVAIVGLTLVSILLMLMANKLSNRVEALEKYTGIEVKNDERNKNK